MKKKNEKLVDNKKPIVGGQKLLSQKDYKKLSEIMEKYLSDEFLKEYTEDTFGEEKAEEMKKYLSNELLQRNAEGFLKYLESKDIELYKRLLSSDEAIIYNLNNKNRFEGASIEALDSNIEKLDSIIKEIDEKEKVENIAKKYARELYEYESKKINMKRGLSKEKNESNPGRKPKFASESELHNAIKKIPNWENLSPEEISTKLGFSKSWLRGFINDEKRNWSLPKKES